MNRKVTFIAAAAVLTATAGAFAATSDQANELDPSSVRVRLVETKAMPFIGGPVVSPTSNPVKPPTGPVSPTPAPHPAPAPSNNAPDFHDIINDTGQVIGTIDQIVNLGQKIFNIIAQNKPVVNITVNYASAMPQGITNWTQLAGWQAPVAKTYELTANNNGDEQIADVTYQVVFNYGGSYNGHGKYLSSVSVQPLTVNAGWGHTFNFACQVPDSSIANAGTTDDPIAAMQLMLNWTDKTVLSEKDGTTVFYVRGDGVLENLSGGSTARSMGDIQALSGVAK